MLNNLFKSFIKLNDLFVNLNLKSQVLIGENSKFYSGSKVVNITKEKYRIQIGNHCNIRGELLVFGYGGTLTIGNYCFIGEGSRIWVGEKISIGSNVLIAHNVNIIDTNSHELNAQKRAKGYQNLVEIGHSSNKGEIETAKIQIDNHAWISFGASILKGVHVGEGAIVGAGSVVTKDVKPYTLVAGNPAQFIKNLKEQ